MQALIDRPLPRKRLARWLAAGAVLWLAVPIALGASPTRFILLAIGIVAAVLVLLALGEQRRWAIVAVPLVLAGELAAAAAFSQLYQGGTVRLGLESGDHANLLPGPLRAPDVAERAFLRTGPIARFLADHPGDRYFTYAPPASNYVKGYLWTQGERDWPALENERGTLFGIPDVFGYNPVQLPRYWSWIRAVNPLPIFYNASVLPRPTLQQLRLLGARYLIIPKGVPLPGDVTGSIVATEDGYDLYEVFGSQPRASVVSEWSVAGDAAEALRTVLEPRFDPGAEAVLERDPGITPAPSGGAAASPGTASYREAAPEDVRVSVACARAVDRRGAHQLGRGVDGDGRRCSRAGAASRLLPPGRPRAGGPARRQARVSRRQDRERAARLGDHLVGADRGTPCGGRRRAIASRREAQAGSRPAGTGTAASASEAAGGRRETRCRRPATKAKRVQRGHDDQQVAIADDDRSILQHAADHGPEQVGAERRRGRAHVLEALRRR